MRVLKAHHEHGVELVGVPGLVPRPVDIDSTHTGFAILRTLRIYRFMPPYVIDGHAEEDEVFMVLLAGSAELVIRSEQWASNTTRFTLAAAGDLSHLPCVAYLPPHAEYALTPLGLADVAYARARPSLSRPPAIIAAAPRQQADGAWMLLDDSSHAQRLRIRLLQQDAGAQVTGFAPLTDSDTSGETLLHVRTTPSHGAISMTDMDAGISTSTSTSMLDSWDTLVVNPGERPRLQLTAGSSVTALLVAAL